MTDVIDIEAMTRAWQAALDARDHKHAAALEKAIKFHERKQREREAGMMNSVVEWIDA
jgi:hypothetical protein